MTNSVGLNIPNSPKYYALRNEYNVQRELGRHQLTQYNQHTTDDELSITEHTSYANTAQFLGIQYGRPEQSLIRRHTKKCSSSVISRANTSHDNTAVIHKHRHTSAPSPSNSSDSSHSMTPTLSSVTPHSSSESFDTSTMKMNESRRSSVIHSQAAFLTL